MILYDDNIIHQYTINNYGFDEKVRVYINDDKYFDGIKCQQIIKTDKIYYGNIILARDGCGVYDVINDSKVIKNYKSVIFRCHKYTVGEYISYLNVLTEVTAKIKDIEYNGESVFIHLSDNIKLNIEYISKNLNRKYEVTFRGQKIKLGADILCYHKGVLRSGTISDITKINGETLIGYQQLDGCSDITLEKLNDTDFFRKSNRYSDIDIERTKDGGFRIISFSFDGVIYKLNDKIRVNYEGKESIITIKDITVDRKSFNLFINDIINLDSNVKLSHYVNDKKEYYMPLPTYLTIKKSNIEGLGMFATEDIKKDFFIGITHIKNDNYADGLIRTPLGGFFNHSSTPNCKIISDDKHYYLITIEDIKKGDEITAFYTLYDPSEK